MAAENPYAGAMQSQAMNQLRANTVAPPRQARKLDGINEAADRVMQLNIRVAAMLQRICGEGPEETTGDQAIAISYTNNLTRLHDNLERLESSLTALEEFA